LRWEQAQDVLQAEHLTGLTDVGYFSGEQVKQAAEKDFEILVPVPTPGEAAAQQGRFTRGQLHYDAETDGYRCPQGEALPPCGTWQERDGRRIQVYKSKVSVVTAARCAANAWAKTAAIKKE
jgi:hypothetical protein